MYNNDFVLQCSCNVTSLGGLKPINLSKMNDSISYNNEYGMDMKYHIQFSSSLQIYFRNYQLKINKYIKTLPQQKCNKIKNWLKKTNLYKHLLCTLMYSKIKLYLYQKRKERCKDIYSCICLYYITYLIHNETTFEILGSYIYESSQEQVIDFFLKWKIHACMESWLKWAEMSYYAIHEVFNCGVTNVSIGKYGGVIFCQLHKRLYKPSLWIICSQQEKYHSSDTCFYILMAEHWNCNHFGKKWQKCVKKSHIFGFNFFLNRITKFSAKLQAQIKFIYTKQSEWF